MARAVQSSTHMLREEYDNVVMKKEESVADFCLTFSKMMLEFRNLGEK